MKKIYFFLLNLIFIKNFTIQKPSKISRKESVPKKLPISTSNTVWEKYSSLPDTIQSALLNYIYGYDKFNYKDNLILFIEKIPNNEIIRLIKKKQVLKYNKSYKICLSSIQNENT